MPFPFAVKEYLEPLPGMNLGRREEKAFNDAAGRNPHFESLTDVTNVSGGADCEREHIRRGKEVALNWKVLGNRMGWRHV